MRQKLKKAGAAATAVAVVAAADIAPSLVTPVSTTVAAHSLGVQEPDKDPHRLVEMGVDHEGLGVLLLSDNQSSMKIAHNLVFHERNKHIAIRYHFIQEKVESGETELKLVRTKAMAAGQLTKNVGLQVLVSGKDLMRMIGS